MKQNNIRPETSPHSEQATQPCQKLHRRDLHVDQSVPIMAFEGKDNFYAILRVGSYGQICLTVYGICEPYHIDADILPGMELQHKFTDFPISLNPA